MAICTLFTFTSCEQTNVNLEETNLIVRLESFHNQHLDAATRQLKDEGYYSLEFDNMVAFSKGPEQYSLIATTDNIINSSSYMQSKEKTSDLESKYSEWKNLIQTKGVTGMKYVAQISAEKFKDLEGSYVDSIQNADNTWTYIYDNEMKFNFVYSINKATLIEMSERWYTNKINEGVEYSLQMTTQDPQPGSMVVGGVGIQCSNFTIK